MGNDLSNKYVQKLLDSAKKSRTDAIKTASKRAIQKTSETTGETSVSKKPATELHSKELPYNDNNNNNNNNNYDVEITAHKIHISKKKAINY